MLLTNRTAGAAHPNFEIPDPIGKICYFMEPTHWMELPESPEPMEEEEND